MVRLATGPQIPFRSLRERVYRDGDEDACHDPRQVRQPVCNYLAEQHSLRCAHQNHDQFVDDLDDALFKPMIASSLFALLPFHVPYRRAVCLFSIRTA